MASSIHEVGINIWNSVPAAAQDAKAATFASSSEDALALDAIKLSTGCKALGKLAGLEKEALRSQWPMEASSSLPNRHTARVWSAAWAGTDEFWA